MVVPVHFMAGSPVVPEGHLHLNVPTEFSQIAPSPQGNALHSSISIQARLTGKSWNPGKHLHIGTASWTKHCALGKQVAVSHGSETIKKSYIIINFRLKTVEYEKTHSNKSDNEWNIPSQSGPTFGSGQLQAPLVQIAFPGQLLLLVHATALVQERVIALNGSPFGQLHRNVPGAFWHCASLPQDVRSRHSSMSEILNQHEW